MKVNSPLNDKDLSIIIQGKLYNGKTYSSLDVLNSVRTYFPHAEVILSTWIGDAIPKEIEALVDQVVLSEDPGDTTPSQKPLNINRQLVSSLAGLRAATRRFAIKTRTDILFTSDNILSMMTTPTPKERVYKVSKDMVLVSDITTRTHLRPNILQRKSHKSLTYMPFWVCDFLYAGLKEDLINIFDIPLYPDSYMIEYKGSRPSGHQHDFKYTPETYLTFTFLAKKNSVPFQYSFDNNPKATKFYEQSLVDNFLICSLQELGIDSAKYYLPLLPPRQRLLPTRMRLIRYKKNNKTKIFKLLAYHLIYYKEYFIEYSRYKKTKKLFLIEK
ncbi:WavE lipopolysaccharide synthesis family protein [Vibrio sp. VNB-15]